MSLSNLMEFKKEDNMPYIKCPHCGYEWDSRIKKPKKCPRCARRLDWPLKAKQDKSIGQL